MNLHDYFTSFFTLATTRIAIKVGIGNTLPNDHPRRRCFLFFKYSYELTGVARIRIWNPFPTVASSF